MMMMYPSKARDYDQVLSQLWLMPTLVSVCLSWFYHLVEPFLSAQGLQMANGK